MKHSLHRLTVALPAGVLLFAVALVGTSITLPWRRKQTVGAAPGAGAPATHGGEALPRTGAAGEAERAAVTAALAATGRVNMAAWMVQTVWARSGLVLDLWGAQSPTGPALSSAEVGRAAAHSGIAHGAGEGQPSRRGRREPRSEPPPAPVPPLELYLRGQTAHVRSLPDLASAFGEVLGGQAAVFTQDTGQAMIRVPRVEGRVDQNAATGAGLWKAALRARTVLAPLGSASGAADVAFYGEVQRGLLVAVATEEGHARASATLLAAAAGLLSSLPAGGAELYLAAHPLSPLSALTTMPILAAEPTPPDRTDLLGGLLDRAMEDDRSEALRRLRVVVLDHALAALATSPALCARLETALVQGPARGLVILASTALSRDLPESTLAAFVCRLLLGPCPAGAGELTRALPEGVALPALERTQALWVDRRAGTGYLCMPWSLERECAAPFLGIAPAVLDLPGDTADRPRPGRTLLVLRLLGGLTATTPDGQPLGVPGGLRQSQSELLAFLATRWGQCVPPDEVPPALLAAVLPTRMALAGALPPDGGGGKGSVLAVRHESDGMQAGLVEESVWVDSVAFAALCRAADATAGPGDRLALLERAIALYGGDFLGQAVPPWAEAERTRLRTLYCEALHTAAELASAAGDHAQATQRAERLREAVGAEDERATLLCLQVHGAAGNLAGVEDAYSAHRATLAEVEVGPPAAAVAALYQDLVCRLDSSHTPGPRPAHTPAGGGARV